MVQAKNRDKFLAEKEKLIDLPGSENVNETVQNTIYPLEKEKDVGKNELKELLKESKKSP